MPPQGWWWTCCATLMTPTYIKEGVACLTDFGWRACQLKAAIEKICSLPLP